MTGAETPFKAPVLKGAPAPEIFVIPVVPNPFTVGMHMRGFRMTRLVRTHAALASLFCTARRVGHSAPVLLLNLRSALNLLSPLRFLGPLGALISLTPRTRGRTLLRNISAADASAPAAVSSLLLFLPSPLLPRTGNAEE
ncbi:MAG: hypothetical protein M3N54_01350 [Acidobacteriota bacterium]|nr:hypothetical protein [Acidobacteriota bacterium]